MSDINIDSESRLMSQGAQISRLRGELAAAELNRPRGAPDGTVKVDGGMISTAASASGSQGGAGGTTDPHTIYPLWVCEDGVPVLVSFYVA